MTVDKNGMLQEVGIHFEVLQEYSSAARGERIILGHVRLNLAEYVDAVELDEDDGVCRRYLMQDSKINSTLKIGITMTLVEGERNFTAPPLKTAPVFGGIAGIMAGDQGDTDDAAYMPSLSSKSREVGEIQDMYRRNLAAYWCAQPGELRADECIEDIFAGGDGWASKEHAYDSLPDSHHLGSGESGIDDLDVSRAMHMPHPARNANRGMNSSPKSGNHTSSQDLRQRPLSGAGGRSILKQHVKNIPVTQQNTNTAYEVDEIDLREDLRSWRLTEQAS